MTVKDAAGNPTAYTYGPFGGLYTVTTPGNALTRTTRDAFGRVVELDDPDRGTTTSIHDGFGELMGSTDALGRVVALDYDPLGRNKSRADTYEGQTLNTTWTWDTASHGVGKLQQLTGPDGTKSYTYTPLSQLQTLTLAVNGESDTFAGTLAYDNFGRVTTITYPAPAGAAPFAVVQQYDGYGHVITVRDSTSNLAYWNLTDVDNAGRFKSETFGNGVSTTRSYYADKQSLQGILTDQRHDDGANLAYEYDTLVNLTARTDALQSQNTTEQFPV